MQCEYQCRLCLYHDNELPFGEQAALEGHLATCAACRQELIRLERLSVLFAAAQFNQISPPATNGVRLRQNISRLVALRLAKMLNAVAAILFLCFGANIYLNQPRLTVERNPIGEAFSQRADMDERADAEDPLTQDFTRD